MKIEVIGMPIYYGCDVKGTELTYDKVENKLNTFFKKNTFVKKSKIETQTKELVNKYEDSEKLKYVTSIMNMNQKLYQKTMETLRKGNLPVMIGGDHSGAIGSICASLDYYQGDVSVIWVDSHLDIHTDEDSPSGNIHGIPLSVCIGRCKNEKLKIGKHKLKPTNLYYIGPRDDGKGFEQEEIDYVRNQHVTCFMDEEVNTRGIEAIVEEIASKIKTKKVHVSFDFDCITVDDFPAVNVCYQGTFVGRGGISFETAQKTLELLLTKLDVCSVDLVEYNALMDKDNRNLKKVEEIIQTIDEIKEG